MQPNPFYVDGMAWNTNTQSSPGDVIEGMYLPEVSDTASEMNV